MIVREFSAGWGDNLPLRQFERDISDTYLRRIKTDAVATVLINSTWYSEQYHQQVMAELEIIQPQRVIVVAMMDPAIPQLDWYSRPQVWGLGYYKGTHEIDVWALIVDRYFQARTTSNSEMINTAFLCFNRKPHWHRRKLYQELQDLDLLARGVVTMGDESGLATRTLAEDVAGSPLAPNAGPEQFGIANDIMTLGPPGIWERCFLNVVTETVFDIDRQWFVSEKIYKPVLGLRPFLVYAPKGAESWLSHVGLDSYRRDFSDISDSDPGDPAQLPVFLRDLAQQPPAYLQHKYLALRDKILHNRNMFDRHVQRTWDHVYQGAICQT